VRSSVLAAVVGLFSMSVAFAMPQPAVAQSASVQKEKTAFYADVRAKRYEAAIVEGALAHKHDPADERFALDYVYALFNAHRPVQATAILEHLKNSRLPAVRTAAQRQLAAQAPEAAPAEAAILPPTSSASPPPFTNAYELLASGDMASSRDAFIATLADHPENAPAWRQLSYIDFVLHDRPGMIAALDHYIALMPDDDRAKLERAYALLAAGNVVAGRAALVALSHSPTAEVADAAKAQLAAGSGIGGRPARLDAFGYALNDSRFHDTFYGLDVRYALATTRIEPYLAFHFSNDAKASSLPASEVLNDNVAILALGLRTKLTPILYAFVEGGEAQALLTGRIQTDLRYGLLLSTRLGSGGFKPQTEIDASLTDYSRYVNTIFYANVAHDFYIGSKVVRGVVGTNLALDTSRAFYNNAAEGFAGVQVRSGPFTFRLIATGGTYLGRGIDPPAQRTYTSLRPEVLFGYQH
jgi:hypothetical protein